MVALAEILVYECCGVCISICACDAWGLVGGGGEEGGAEISTKTNCFFDSFSCYSYSYDILYNQSCIEGEIN